MIVDCLQYTKSDAIIMLPPYVEEIGRNPEILDFLRRNVGTLFWAGGEISLAAGNAISSKVRLFTTCGSTETGMWPSLHRSGRWPSEQWKFMRIHPSANMEFRHQEGDLYEAYIKRAENPDEEQPVFKVFPSLQEFSSGDLFSPEPSDPELWQYRGRTDDMQVFSTAEKFHPTAVENHIASHSDVQAALLVGTNRAQAALLLEAKTATIDDPPERRSKAVERLWPIIEDANAMCPTYAKVTKERILFVSPLKPMVRTAKGNVQRSKTVKLYQRELDEL